MHGRGGGGARRDRGARGRRDRGSPTAKPQVGDRVAVVRKQDYGTDVRIVGIVARVLTRSAQHARGFKVQLVDGVIGRCTDLIDVAAIDESSGGGRLGGGATPREADARSARRAPRGAAELAVGVQRQAKANDKPSSEDEMSSEEYLAALNLEGELAPPPGQRLADVE